MLIYYKRITIGPHQRTNSLRIIRILPAIHHTRTLLRATATHQDLSAKPASCLRHLLTTTSVATYRHQGQPTQVLLGASNSFLSQLLRMARIVQSRAAGDKTGSYTLRAIDPTSIVDGHIESVLNAESGTASRIVGVSALVTRYAIANCLRDYRRSATRIGTDCKNFSIPASSRNAGFMRHMLTKMVGWRS
jgi:hypothetical protein